MNAPRRRVHQALYLARQRLLACGGASDLEAQLLLAHALGRSRTWLVAHGDELLQSDQQARVDALVTRRAAGEPVAYILGRREFWSLDLDVTPAVLIPRPDTECLVEEALALLPEGREALVCDVGTGSGAVAIALARERPRARVLAGDASAPALAVAAGNAVRIVPGRVALFRGDWLRPLADACLDLVTSNPPYVSEDDPHLAQGDVRFEPRHALDAGPGGLSALTTLARQAPRRLRPGGWLVVEHGPDQDQAVRDLFAAAGLERIATRRDPAGHPRITRGRRPGAAAGAAQ